MRVIAVVGARLNSSRLPVKHLMLLAGQPMIKRIFERLSQCKALDTTVLATTKDDYNQPLLDWATSNQLPYLAYDGDVNNLMGRVNAVVKSYHADIVVYICGDCPLIDPEFIDHAIKALSEPDAETVSCHPDVITVHEGMHFYTRNGWDKLFASSCNAKELEHVGYADKNQSILKHSYIKDVYNFSVMQQRISVDTPADYEFMSRIYDLWYSKHNKSSIVSLKWVQETLEKNDSLSTINAHVVQRLPGEDYIKISLYCHVSPTIGIGHLKRCALIGDYLQECFGFGTVINICGKKENISWLSTNTVWHENEGSLLISMQVDKNQLWVLDFHPDYIACNALVNICQHAKEINNTAIIALDKLSILLPVVDKLFIPSFFSAVKGEKVDSGWKNYLIKPNFESLKKKRILVLTGGSDALKYGDFLPVDLDKNISQDWAIDWIQGPYSQDPNIPLVSSRFHVHKSPKNLEEMLRDSEVIITCYGLSLFEALAAGALTILLPVKNLCSIDELVALKNERCCYVLNDEVDIGLSIANALKNNKELLENLKNAKHLLKNTNGLYYFGNLIVDILRQHTLAH